MISINDSSQTLGLIWNNIGFTTTHSVLPNLDAGPPPNPINISVKEYSIGTIGRLLGNVRHIDTRLDVALIELEPRPTLSNYVCGVGPVLGPDFTNASIFQFESISGKPSSWQ